jgi:hypothetical protein
MRRKLRANYCFMASGLQLPVTGCRLPVTGCPLPVAGCLLPVGGCPLPVAGSRYRLPLAIDDLRHLEQETPDAFRESESFFVEARADSSQLVTGNGQRVTTNQLATGNRQPVTGNGQLKG